MKTNNLKIFQTVNFRKLKRPIAICISALFIISMLSVFSLSTVQAATVTTFGNSAVGTYLDQNDPNAQSISYFTSTTTGSVTDIIAYISGASSGNAITALYQANGNSAGALLEQSNSVNIGTTYSWVDFQLPTPYTVTSGTTYGLAVMGNVPVNIVEVAGSGQRAHNGASSYANGFANPFGAIWGIDNSGAMSIYATGTGTNSPTPPPSPPPTPTQTPTQSASSSANLEPLSAFYADMNGAASSYASLDYGTLHNGNPSIRTGPDYVRGSREVDGAWLGVKPGDHIVFSAWVKTASYESSDICAGIRLGMDFYISSSQGNGIATIDAVGHQAGHPSDAENMAGVARLPWGNDWTLLTWDIYVPTTYYTYVTNGAAGNYGVHSCNPVQISSMVPWFDTRSLTDNAYSWFSDTTFYINP